MNNSSGYLELYHIVNDVHNKDGLGTHFGSLKYANDLLKSYKNKQIEKVSILIMNPVRLSCDYILYNNLNIVLNKLYKDKIITEEEKKINSFFNLRKLLYDKYGYDGCVYKNNIEDKGNDTYIVFFTDKL